MSDKALSKIREAKAQIDQVTQDYQQEYLKVQEEIQVYKKAIYDQ